MSIIPIIFTFDKRIILAASVAIQSLVKSAKNSTVYDIHILHSDLKLDIQKELTKLISNTNHAISFHYIDPKQFDGFKKSRNSWSEIVYYRLLIPDVFKNYDKVIYSDVDVFFKKDLEEIYQTNIKDYEFGAVKAEKNTPNSICHKYFKENTNELIYWSGFLLMNCKKLRENNFVQRFKKTAIDFKDKLRFFDLDVLNITSDSFCALPFNYCVLEAVYEFEDLNKIKDYNYLKEIYSDNDLKEGKTNPAIIHYAGQLGKPWRRKNTPNYYQKEIDLLPKKLKKYTFRDFRKKLFSKI